MRIVDFARDFTSPATARFSAPARQRTGINDAFGSTLAFAKVSSCAARVIGNAVEDSPSVKGASYQVSEIVG
jgi:hypothetical protein